MLLLVAKMPEVHLALPPMPPAALSPGLVALEVAAVAILIIVDSHGERKVAQCQEEVSRRNVLEATQNVLPTWEEVINSDRLRRGHCAG